MSELTFPPLSIQSLSPEVKLSIEDHLSRAIQIPTVSHLKKEKIDYPKLTLLHQLLEEIYPIVHQQLTKEVVNQYSLMFTWPGSQPGLDPIMLTGHLDVVPVETGTEIQWEKPPFSGINADGFIWGRGTLDCKSIVLAILEAVEYLLKAGYTPQRTIILGFGHDEEIGGKLGASAISGLLQQRGVRLEAVIDEGLAIIENFSPLFPKPCAMIGIAEKGYMTILLNVQTTGGHSSTPPKETAISILSATIGKLSRQPMPARLSEIVKELFRRIAPHQKGFLRFLLNNHRLFSPLLLGKFEASPAMNAMVRTTFAPTIFQAGIKDNILPTSASAAVNIRILPGDDIDSIKKYIKRVVDDPRVEIQVQSEFSTNPSPISSTSASSFQLLEKTILEIFPETIVAPGLVLGATDCRYYQSLTSNAYRFMPIVVQPQDMGRVHGANERIGVDDYCQAVVFYQKLIQNWSS